MLSVNLSENLLSMVPAAFPLLFHITKLNLSKNQLVELPDNFGSLKCLKSLDLSTNQLVKLPFGFAQLEYLKWLDLKENPLCSTVKQVAGDCIKSNDFFMCAVKVVALMQSMASRLQKERQKPLTEELEYQGCRQVSNEMEKSREDSEKEVDQKV